MCGTGRAQSAARSARWPRRRATTELCRAASVTGTRPGEFEMSLEQGLDKCLGVEWAQVVLALAGTDETHGQSQLVADRENNAALRRAVQLRERDCRDVDRLGERLRLDKGVLA